MCMNYERQLQKMQEENQKFQNLASNLQVELDQEKLRKYFFLSFSRRSFHIVDPLYDGSLN